MQNINQVLRRDFLPQLIQPDFFVGWTYSIDYDYAFVMTNDLWKAKALGVPHNCFLAAAAFNPEAFADTPEIDREVILLRVISSARLPQDDDMVRTKVDFFQQRTGVFATEGEHDIDDITLNQLQFGGLKCRVFS